MTDSRRHLELDTGASRSPDVERWSEAGDTLLEILLAVVVLGLATVALMIGFSTSISASATHRQLATSAIVLDSASQEAISQIQQQAALFSQCFATEAAAVTYYQLNVPLATTPYSSTYSAQVTAVQYWNSSSASFSLPPYCNANSPQQITVTVTKLSGGQTYLNTFVVNYPLASAGSASNSGPATQLVIIQQPVGGPAGIPFATQPIVAVENASGQPVTTDLSPVTLTVTNNAGVIVTGCSGDEINGVVTFTGCAISTAGTYTLTAVDGSLTSTPSSSFTITAAANKLVFTTQPVAGASGSTLATQPVVAIETAGGTVFPMSATLTLTPSGGSLSGCSGLTTTNGIFNLSGCAFAGAYSSVLSTYYTLNATVAGLITATSSPFNPSSFGSASQLVFSTQPSGVASGTLPAQFSVQPIVTVEDSFGNIVTNYATSVSLSISAGETLGGCRSQTPSNGVATFSGCTANAYLDTVTLKATSGSLSVTSNSFNITRVATQLVFTTQPVAGVSGATLTTQPVVAFEDSLGNVVTSSVASITLSPSGGALSLCSVLTPTNGVVNVASCTFAGLVNTNYTLTAASAGLTSGVSSTFTPTGPGLATQLAFTTEPVAGPAGDLFTTEPIVKVEDSAGNVVTSTSPTTTLTPSGGTLASCSNLTAVVGVVSVANCTFGGTVGTNYTLTATTSGLTSDVSANFTPSMAGDPTQIVLTGCASSIYWNANCSLTASVEDAFNNVELADSTTGLSFNPVSSTALGALSGLVSLSDTNGVASVVVTGAGVGTVTVNVTGGGFASNQVVVTILGAPQSAAFYTDGTYGTVTPGNTVTYSPAGNYQLFAKGSDSGTITYTSTTTGVCIVNSSTGVVTYVTAGTCTLTAVAASTIHYATSSTATFTLTINKANQATLFVTSLSAVYGSPLTLTTSGGSGLGALTYSVVNGTATGCTNTGGVLTSSSAGTCLVTANKASDINYNATSSAQATVTISPASTVVVTAANQTLTYTGGPAVADSSSVSGLKYSDAATVSSATYTYSGTGGTIYGPSTTRPTNVGTYSVVPSAATLNFSTGGASSYTTPYTYGAGTLTINMATLTVTAANQNLTYTGSQAAADTSAVGGLQGSDAATVTSATYNYTGTGGTIYGPSTTRPTNAGTYSIVPSVATLSFSSGLASNYSSSFTYVNATLTINVASTLIVTAGNQALSYTGSAAVADTAIVTGELGTDNANVTSATYTYAGTGGTIYGPSTTRPTHVGTYSITPSVATLSFSTGLASNYSSSYTYVAGTLTISASSTLSVTAGTQTVTYTANQVVADTSTVTGGLLGSDAATVTSATYTYTGTGGTTYGPSTARPTNVGTYSVMPSAATLNFTTGAALDYTTPYNYFAGTLTVTAVKLTVTAANQTLTYTGSAAVADTANVTGELGTDNANVTSAIYTYTGTGGTTYGPSTTRPTNVGTYTVAPTSAILSFSSGLATNYSASFTYVSGTLTINIASTLTVTAGNQSMTYTGSAATADTSVVGGRLGTDAATVTSATYTYTGTGGTTYGPSTTRPTNAGTYSVTPSAATLSFSSGLASNYSSTYTYVAGTLTITASSTVTVTAANQAVTYTGSQVVADSSTVTSGLLGSDAATVTSATYSYTGTGGTTYGPSTTRPTNAGTYSVTPSAATLNFTTGAALDYTTPYTYVAGTLTISKASLTVTAANQTVSYTGSPVVADSSNVAGLLGTDAATVTSATYSYTGTGGTIYGPSTTRPTSAGTYSVVASVATLNFSAGLAANYNSTFTYVAGTVTISAASTLTVTGANQSLNFTAASAVADTSSVSAGLLGTDAATVTSATYTYTGTGGTTYGPSTTRPTNVGTYSVMPSAATLNFTSGSASNYTTPYTYVAGTLTINKSTTLTVTAANQNLTYPASSAVADTSSVSGLLGGDTASVQSATYTYLGISGTTYGPLTTAPTNAGTYSVTPSAATLNFSSGLAANYNPTYTYVAGTLTIAKTDQATLTVTSTSTLYGTSLTLTTSGGSGTGAVTYVAANGTATGCTNTAGVLTSTSAGTCTVTATKALDSNYNVVSSGATTVKIVGTQSWTGTSSGSNTVASASISSVTQGSPVLIMVSNVSSSNSPGVRTCSSVSGSSITGATPISSQTWLQVSSGNIGYWVMCVYSATETSTTGAVTATFNNGTTTRATIQIVVIQGDNAATFALSSANSTNATMPAAPSFNLSSAPPAGTIEVLFGDMSTNSASNTASWSGAPAGFSSVAVIGVQGTAPLNFSPIVYVGRPAALATAGSITGTASATVFWGTIGIEVVP